MVQISHPYMTTGKTIALAIRTFVCKMMSLLLNMQCRFIIAFLPRSKCLLISWLQSPSEVILELKKIKNALLSWEKTTGLGPRSHVFKVSKFPSNFSRPVAATMLIKKFIFQAAVFFSGQACIHILNFYLFISPNLPTLWWFNEKKY